MPAPFAPPAVGFAAEEVDPSVSTRHARLKWVIVVDESLPPGRAANAAICAASATIAGVSGLLGPDAQDADGTVHPGLPWSGCTIVVADAARIRSIRLKASTSEGMFIADMPGAAQHTRVYAEYLDAVAQSAEDALDYYAVSLVGPRNRIGKLVGDLPLMP